ncbi:MAG: hypothetical protein QG608_1776 [Actinomycetota bacterium]|nr:hypothetical protein [Actinomycetota bacterium]
MVPVSTIRDDVPFIGRSDELARLSALVDRAGAGSACAVLLAGDAGVGKTRLVCELTRRLRRSDLLVAVGHCVDLGAAGLPYLPFVEALTDLVRQATGPGPTPVPGAREVSPPPGPAGGAAVEAVLAERPVLGRMVGLVPKEAEDPTPYRDETAQRMALFEAVAVLLAELGRRVAPVLLVLEDLHWADSETRDLLRFLLARLDTESLLVVGTYRSEDLHRRHPLRPVLAELVRLPRVERLRVPPFTEPELRDFLHRIHGSDLPEPVVRAIADRSEGNAYYAEELLAVGGGLDGLPTGLSEVVLARLERLPSEVQVLARTASVAGRGVREDMLRQACSLSAAPFEEALREAVAHQVLVAGDRERLEFRHALLQESVYRDLLPGERVRTHARYAQLLTHRLEAGEGSCAAELVRHCLAAHDLPGALRAGILAGDESVRRLAPSQALQHYEQALQLWEAVAPDQLPENTDLVRLTLQAADAAGSSGEQHRAVALARQALRVAEHDPSAQADPEPRALATCRLAHHLYGTEEVDEALEQALAAQRLLAGREHSAVRLWAVAIEARIASCVRRTEACDDLIAPALVQARQAGLTEVEADLLISRTLLLGPSDSEADGAAHLDRVRRQAIESGLPGAALRAASNLARTTAMLGDTDEARRVIAEGLAEARRAGLESSLYALELRELHLLLLVLTGDWDEALQVAREARSTLPEFQWQRWPVLLLGVRAARDPQSCLAPDSGLARWMDNWPFQSYCVHVPRAEALLWVGRHREAVETVDEGIARHLAMRTSPHPIGLHLATTALGSRADLLARADLDGSDTAGTAIRAERSRLLELAHESCDLQPEYNNLGSDLEGWLARAEAEAARLLGEDDPDLWEQAVNSFSLTRYEQARCRFRWAAALAAAGERAEATDQARRARDVAVALKARPLRDAVDALARRHRLSLGGQGAPPAVLTPRETDVMRLVARGLTNRQIGTGLSISEKTVSVHVSNVLAKLGAGGRTQAVDLAHRRGLI